MGDTESLEVRGVQHCYPKIRETDRNEQKYTETDKPKETDRNVQKQTEMDRGGDRQTDILVFEIICKLFSHGQNRAQCLC